MWYGLNGFNVWKEYLFDFDEYIENVCLFFYSYLFGNLGKNKSCILIGICLIYI